MPVDSVNPEELPTGKLVDLLREVASNPDHFSPWERARILTAGLRRTNPSCNDASD